jgi:TPR repeat protein
MATGICNLECAQESKGMGHFSHQTKGSRTANKMGAPVSWAPYNRSLRLIDNNDPEAFRLNSIAAENGMHDAVLAMGWFYLNGVGVKANQAEAIRWYRKSARQGEPRAMFSLGHISYFRRDYADALVWFERAVKIGHHRSGFWIGKMYWRGRGVEQDQKRAREYFAQAAAKKVAEAQRAIRFLSFLARREHALSE